MPDSHDFEDKPTNGYRQDKRLIEFRLDEMQTALKAVSASQARMEIAFTELKTEFRWRAGIFGVVGAALIILGKFAVEKAFGG